MDSHTSQNQSVSLPPASQEASDELDQDWVRKAKAIVEETKNNPHGKSSGLAKAKADYLKQRFNRDIGAED
jgi:hypothetical protein